jgi:hypothetical protein
MTGSRVSVRLDSLSLERWAAVNIDPRAGRINR